MRKASIILIIFSIIVLGCGTKSPQRTSQDTAGTKENISTGTSGSVPAKDSVINEAKNIKKPSGDIQVLSFDKNSIPKECEYKGNIETGSRWIDNNGENILIISNTPVKQINNDERDQNLYAYCYAKSGDSYTLLWQINDYVKSPCDIGAEYLPSTLEVKDLDGDGIAENAFIYKLEGRCDVSPLTIKLMIHSGSKKLVIRGTTKVDIGNGEKVGGEKHFDAAFNSSPDVFKTYASDKWDEFVKSYRNP